jgi:hypothetical protein
MKIRIISIIQIFLTAFLMIGSQIELFSQEADSVSVKRPGLFVGVCLGPSQSHILNEGILSVSNLRSDRQTSFGAGVEIGYFFSKNIGVSSGIGFASYKTQLTLRTYQNKFNAIDSENEAYERQVSGTGIQEVQKLGFLSIPVCLNIRLPLNKTFGFYLQTGINLAVPINKKYMSSGTFSFKGYYPAYNVRLENLPAYGFPDNVKIETGGKLEIKPVCLNAIASAGFDFFVQKRIAVALAASYSRSLPNISAYASPEKFQLSSDVNQVNSLMGGSSKTSVQSIGVNITLRYFLKERY